MESRGKPAPTSREALWECGAAHRFLGRRRGIGRKRSEFDRLRGFRVVTDQAYVGGSLSLPTRPTWGAPVVTDRPTWGAPVVTDRPTLGAPVVTDRPTWGAPVVTDRPTWGRPVLTDEAYGTDFPCPDRQAYGENHFMPFLCVLCDPLILHNSSFILLRPPYSVRRRNFRPRSSNRRKSPSVEMKLRFPEIAKAAR